MINNYAALQKSLDDFNPSNSFGISFSGPTLGPYLRLGFLFEALPSGPVIVSNVGFTKYLPSMCINPITSPSRQDDLFPGTTQSVASIDAFIVFLVDVLENKKGVLRCAATTWTGLRSLARRMRSLLDFTPCSPLSTC